MRLGQALKVPASAVQCLRNMAEKLLRADKQITVIVATLAPIDDTPVVGRIPLLGTLIGTLNAAIKVVRMHSARALYSTQC